MIVPTMANTDEAKIEHARAETGIRVWAQFSGNIDISLAEDTDNYVIKEYNSDYEVDVLKAYYYEEENKVLLITTGLKAGRAFKLTVTNIGPNEMSNYFAGRDLVEPSVKEANAVPGGKVILTFGGDLDIEKAEDVNSYLIKKDSNVLPVYSAIYCTETNTVEVASDSFLMGNVYSILIQYIADGYKTLFVGFDTP